MRIILFYLRVLILRSLNLKTAIIFSMIASTAFYLLEYVNRPSLDQQIIGQIHSFGIFFITVIASTSFFPLYISRVSIVKNHFPIRLVEKYIIEVIINCLNVRSILILLTILFIGILTKSGGVVTNLLIFSISILLIEQNLKLLYEYPKRRYSIIAVVVNLALIPVSISLILGNIASWFVIFITMGSLICSAILHILSRNLQNKNTIDSLEDTNGVHNFTIAYLRVIYRNGSILSYTGLWLLFVKLLFLPVYFKDFRNHGNSFADDAMTIVIYVMLTVIPLFTYIFNNLWGFLKNTFLTISTRIDTTSSSLRLYFTALIPFILFDLTYNLVYVYLGNRLSFSFILFYFSVLSFAVLIGLFCSGIRPSKVIKSDGFFNIKTHTYLIGNIGLLCSGFILSYLYLTNSYFPIISLGVIFFNVVMIALYIWRYSYRTIKSATEKLILN